jgi:hypothetical protein
MHSSQKAWLAQVSTVGAVVCRSGLIRSAEAPLQWLNHLRKLNRGLVVNKSGERSPFRSIFDCLDGKGKKSENEVADCSANC